MSNEFKNGDRVRVIECDTLDPGQRALLGCIGVVVGVYCETSQGIIYRVEFENQPRRLFYDFKLEAAPQEVTPPDEFYFIHKESSDTQGTVFHARKEHTGDYIVSWSYDGHLFAQRSAYSTVRGMLNRNGGFRWEITRVVEQVQDSPEKQPEFKVGDTVERINTDLRGFNRAKVGERATVTAISPSWLTVKTAWHPRESWLMENAKLVPAEDTAQKLQAAVVASYAAVAEAKKRVNEANDAYNEASRAWEAACSASVAAQKALDVELRKMAGMSPAELL